MTKKAIILRHMKEKRDDHVAKFLNENHVEQLHVNPANGIPFPHDAEAYDALVIYGGIQSANDANERPYIAEEIEWVTNWLNTGRPALGICLGAQLIAKSLGAKVSPRDDRLVEIGFRKVTPTEDADGFLDQETYFYQWHKEGFELPENCELLAQGKDFPNQAFRYQSNVYGFQFHPEVSRQVMGSWLCGGVRMLDRKGAHSAQRQLQDESQYGETMENWILKFMQDWYADW